MTRKFTFLLMALLALAGLKSWGQTEVVIGTGTQTSGCVPFYGNYNYSYNEMLYGPDEIGTAGIITSISFYASGTSSKDYALDIYMKNVDRASFTSTTDYMTSSLSDKVCSTTCYGSQTGWITFDLDTPFVYDGVSTLMIAFDNNTGTYASKYFYYHEASDKSIYRYYDYGNIDPSNPMAMTSASNCYATNLRPNIKINITPSADIHYVTVNQPAVGGTISASPMAALPGTTITLSDEPSFGYEFGAWSITPSVTLTGNTFEMPASDVTVTATFNQATQYAINCATLEGGSIHAEFGGETITQAPEGAVVTLVAVPNANYALGQFIVDGSPIEGNTFTMPASDVTVTATFEYHLTLTVNDGTQTNQYIPIYGNWCDASNQHNQFIIPAEQLADINGGTISSMTFYLSSLATGPWGRTWTVKLMETTETTISSLINVSSATSVYTGVLNGQSSTMEVPFSTPYAYNGGNLLVDFSYSGGSGSFKSASFYGISTTYNSSYYNYNTTSGGPQKFLPKTTFGYVPNPNLHHITVTQPVEGGTISAPASAISGTTVTLTATPELGYEFGAWSITPSVTLTGNTFEMPASDVTITATFNALQQYDITFVGVDETLITVAAKYNNDTINNAPAGTEVTLEYTLLNEGYTFINWTLNGEPLDVNTFEMPANDIEIGVVLNERPRYAVIIDGSIAHGTVTASPNENILSGKTVTLTVTPADSYVLNTLTVTDAESNPVVVTNNQFIMPESNVTVTATFSPVLTLTVNDGTTTQPNGSGNVQIPFAGYYADGTTKSQFIIPASDLTAMIDATITDLTFYLTAPQNKDFGNAKWDICLKEVDYAAVGYSYPEEFANMTKVYSGKLSINNYLFTIHFDTPFIYGGQNLMIGFNQTTSGSYVNTTWLGAENGTDMRSRGSYSETNASFNFLPKTTFTYSNPNLHGITVNQPTEGGEIAASAGAALPGTIITLTATPELGYEFGEWIVSPSTVTITGNTFEMPASDVTVTATFNEVTQYGIAFVGIDETLITVAATFGGETITKAPAGTEVTLQYSNLNIGYTFGNWTLNGEALAGNTFTMPAEAVEVGVVLNERPRFAVTIDEAITNGTITAEPSSEILSGTLVTLTITPETGYTLDVLTVTDAESNPVAVTNNTFTMPESNVTVTATFVHGITVYDGTVTNQYTAVYTFYGDTDNSAAQFVVPAEQLTAMVGGEISSIKFYVDPNNITNLTNLGGPSYAGYITEVTETTMSSFIDFGTATTVFTGHVSLSNNNSELVIDFSAPYTYNGGNLAIAFECTAKAGYTTLNYYGTTVSGGGIYRNSGTGANINNFIPKTTFLYTPVTPYTVNLHVNGVVSEEEVSSLPTPENIPAGMTFCGWTNSDIATYTTEAPSYVTKATADGEDFYAVFSYTEEEQTRGQNWVKITSPSELVDGEEIVLVYNDSYVMGQRSSFGTNYTRHAVEVVDGRIASMPSEANTFTLSESSGNWKLNYNDSEVGNTTLSYNTNDCLAYYGLWEAYECYSYDVWTAEGTSKVIFKNNYNNEYIGEDESEYAELIHSVSNANLACQAFKKDVALVTYYMTSVLTGGTVANATVKNIIVVNPITVSGRLEMNEGGLFRNENTANFVFADGAQFYYTGEESVNATFEKDITGYTGDNDNYYLIANPTDNDVVAKLTDNDYDLYSFDPWGDEDGYEWINEEGEEVYVKPYSNEDGSAVAVGYLYANSEDVTLEFAGVLNPAGSTDIELTYAEEGEGIDFSGFNLIGNPYACKAYVSGYSFYKMVNGELRANNARTANIAPCEGVFVEATAANQQVTVTTTAPNVGEDDINVNVTKNSRGEVIDRAVISFDGRNDMHKFMMNPANTNIRLAKNGQEYAAISCDAEGEIPVSFKAAEDDTYTITVNANNENTRYLHLIDNLTGMDVDLLANPSYTFNALTSDYAYRFKLVFSMNIDNNQSDNTNNFAFMSDGNLVINNIDGEATLQIVDVLGRVVSTEIVSGSYNKALNLKSGLYILNLNGMTQKIVVE